MQHLPQMAIFASILPDKKETLIKEFRNQTLDFFAANPRRIGINWNCTMDVAIRAANLLLAYDLISQIDNNKIIDQEFKKIFANELYDHGIILSKTWNTLML